MSTDDRWHRRSALLAVAVLRSLGLSAAVFALAVVTGALLSGAAPAGPTGSGDLTTTEPVASVATTERTVDLTFARSMIYSGTVALGLSVAGLVMVGRRRRYW